MNFLDFIVSVLASFAPASPQQPAPAANPAPVVIEQPAQNEANDSADSNEEIIEDESAMEDLDPSSPDIAKELQELNQFFANDPANKVEGEIAPVLNLSLARMDSCYRLTCSVYALIDKSKQRMTLYVNGVPRYTDWKVSTGTAGHGTPNFDRHPNGLIFNKYSSKKYPGGDYNGLGNMPYAVFIKGGYAIHGTPRGNWSKLGRRASHGCIRLHPDNGLIFNRLVRQYGVSDTWITVTE